VVIAAKTDRCVWETQRCAGSRLIGRRDACITPRLVDIVAIKDAGVAGSTMLARICHMRCGALRLRFGREGSGRSGRFCAGLRGGKMTIREYLDASRGARLAWRGLIRGARGIGIFILRSDRSSSTS